MKKNFFLSMAVCFALCTLLVLNGCEQLLNPSVDVPLTVNVPINGTTTTSYPVAIPNVVDLTSNSTYNDNKSRIKSATLDKLQLTITEFAGTPDASSADIDFTASLVFDPSYGDNTIYPLGSITGKFPADFATPQPVAVSNAQLNTALSNLATRPKFTVTLSGVSRSNRVGTVTRLIGNAELTFTLKASL